jgi:hypothetical protein
MEMRDTAEKSSWPGSLIHPGGRQLQTRTEFDPIGPAQISFNIDETDAHHYERLFRQRAQICYAAQSSLEECLNSKVHNA